MKDVYLVNVDNKPRVDLIERYIQLQLIFLYPICPHFCEVAHLDYFLPFAKNYKEYPALMGSCRFPQPK
jgi:leucyl-tRNA synthetase